MLLRDRSLRPHTRCQSIVNPRDHHSPRIHPPATTHPRFLSHQPPTASNSLTAAITARTWLRRWVGNLLTVVSTAISKLTTLTRIRMVGTTSMQLRCTTNSKMCSGRIVLVHSTITISCGARRCGRSTSSRTVTLTSAHLKLPQQRVEASHSCYCYIPLFWELWRWDGNPSYEYTPTLHSRFGSLGSGRLGPCITCGFALHLTTLPSMSSF